MSTLCTITGTLRDLTGAVLANTQVIFIRRGVAAQDGSTVIPRQVSATSDSAGILAVTLFAGNYTATTIGVGGQLTTFSVAVPSSATAVLSDLIDAAPTTVTPQAVIDAQAARAGAEAAQAAAQNSAAASTASAADAAASAAQAALEAGYGPIIKNDTVITSNLSLPAGSNGYSVGPIDISVGVKVDVAAGSTWAII